MIMPSRVSRLLKYKEGRELVLLLLSVMTVIVFGVLGYEIVEGWTGIDALYMTIITLASVGFMEVHPLSEPGRIFTIILIVLGVGVFAIALTTIARHVVERQFFILFEKTRMDELIRKLNGHVIVCGFGRLGRIAARDFMEEGTASVVIEKSPEIAREAREAGYLVVEGDATVDEMLVNAGIRDASAVVTLLPKDSDNLYVVLTCRELKPELSIVSRTEDEHGEKRLRRAGADRTVSPYREGGKKIADALLRPHVADFIDKVVEGQGRIGIEEVRVPKDSPMSGLTLVETRLRETMNIIIAAIISPEGETAVNPGGDTRLQPGATLIVLGDPGKLKELEQILSGGKS